MTAAPLQGPLFHVRSQDVPASDATETPELAASLERLREPLRSLARDVAAASPFIHRLLEREGEWLGHVASVPPSVALDALIAEVDAIEGDGDGSLLAWRDTRDRVALLVALTDCGTIWSLERVVQGLSDFADACCRSAWGAAVAAAARRKGRELTAERGGFVLALGKHGARELNYSSDIDLVCFFDRDRAGDAEPGEGFVEAAKRFTALLSARHDGRIAHRVDWRLRPDPGATPLAISTAAALNYYQSQARSWERLAFIKARPVAGDMEAATDFLAELEPFVWRRTLDFSLAGEMARMAERVRAAHGPMVPIDGDPAGWNIKTGRGGIREVEFLVQSQQTILGGRRPQLRAPATLDAIGALTARGVLDADRSESLATGYRFHRTLEHRLQMIDDTQTQAMPPDGEQRHRLASLMGLDTTGLVTQIAKHRMLVSTAFDASVPEAEPGRQEGRTGHAVAALDAIDAPSGDGRSTLAEMGFSDTGMVERVLRAWLASRYPALRSEDARRAGSAMLPTILKAVAATPEPDAVLLALDRLVAKLPAGLQFFAMLAAKPALVTLLVRLAGDAPGYLEGLARDPALIAAVTDADFWSPPRAEDVALRIEGIERRTGGLEAAMDAVRLVNRSEMFRLALRVLEGDDPYRCAADISLVSQVCLDRLWRASCEEKGLDADEVDLAVVSMGRMGSREMSHASDLDLMIVAGTDATAQRDGRLVRTFLAAIGSPTAEGRFRSVDMRLRPSGNSGPLVTTLAGFERHHETAEAWELVALGRARVVAGRAAFAGEVADALGRALARPRDTASMIEGAAGVLERVRRDRPPIGPLDVKGRRGGLFDIEFGVQLSRVLLAPELAGETRTPALIEGLRRIGCPASIADTLSAAHRSLTGMLLHLGVTRGGIVPDEPEPREWQALLKAGGLGSAHETDGLAAMLGDSARAVDELADWVRRSAHR